MKKIILATLFVASVILSFNFCSKDENNNALSRTFVIVPGAWQAPYAWRTVKAQLEATGQKVIVVELPGHGADTTAPQTLSIDAYRDKVIGIIDSLQGKVILVGHSMAGVVISAVAEKIPTRIEKLIYIGAYLPVNSQSLLDLANTDAASLLGKSLVPSEDQLTVDVKRENLTGIFIQDGSAEIQALVLNNYRSEPAIPFTNKVALTNSKYGSVPKFYIHTLEDHVISIDLQNRMVAASGLNNVYQINSSHCPFLSKPDSVTILLTKIAAEQKY